MVDGLECEFFCRPFLVEPVNGELEINSCTQIHVTFFPLTSGCHNGSLELRYDTGICIVYCMYCIYVYVLHIKYYFDSVALIDLTLISYHIYGIILLVLCVLNKKNVV